MGAGSHTTEISGSTITYTKDSFPIKNLPILKLSLEDESQGAYELETALKKKIEWFRLENDFQKIAIAIKIQEYAKGLVNGMKDLIEKEGQLIVVVENDMAKVLGQAIYSLLNFQKEIICIDGIKVENGDYIDLGTPIADGKVLPVVIKTLVFN